MRKSNGTGRKKEQFALHYLRRERERDIKKMGVWVCRNRENLFDEKMFLLLFNVYDSRERVCVWLWWWW